MRPDIPPQALTPDGVELDGVAWRVAPGLLDYEAGVADMTARAEAIAAGEAS